MILMNDFFSYKLSKLSKSSNLPQSKLKCIICDDFSIYNEGFCEICKYYRYTLVKKQKSKAKSKK